MPRPSTIRRVLVAALTAALLWSAPAVAGGLAQKVAAPRKAITEHQSRFTRVKLSTRKRAMRHPGKTRRVFPARIEGSNQKVFARLPRFGVPGAMRRHNFARMIAHQMGRPELVPLAASATLDEAIGDGALDINGLSRDVSAGTEVMLVEDLGDDFITWKEITEDGRGGEFAGAFPEDLRLTGAVLHLLSWQMDGNPANVMIRDRSVGGPLESDVRILDHDVSLGIKHTGPTINGSIFFKGTPVFRGRDLGYASAQARVEDLPEAVQGLVVSLADATSEEIAAAYGLEETEAKMVRTTARDIKKNGLDAAVQRFWAESPKYHDTDYHRRKAAGK
jgi:hypothetical protein